MTFDDCKNKSVWQTQTTRISSEKSYRWFNLNQLKINEWMNLFKWKSSILYWIEKSIGWIGFHYELWRIYQWHILWLLKWKKRIMNWCMMIMMVIILFSNQIDIQKINGSKYNGAKWNDIYCWLESSQIDYHHHLVILNTKSIFRINISINQTIRQIFSKWTKNLHYYYFYFNTWYIKYHLTYGMSIIIVTIHEYIHMMVGHLCPLPISIHDMTNRHTQDTIGGHFKCHSLNIFIDIEWIYVLYNNNSRSLYIKKKIIQNDC